MSLKPGALLGPVVQGLPIAFDVTPEWVAKEAWQFGYCSMEASQTKKGSQLSMKVWVELLDRNWLHLGTSTELHCMMASNHC